MREILFRGKRKDNGKWVEGHYCEYYSGKEKVPCISISKETIGGSLYYDVIPETIGQYTSLTDKNDTKIFEGDVVQNVTEGKTAVVQWFSEHSAFMLWCKSENQIYWLYDNDFLNIEIIGNIYDNPELIGGESNGI